jgi:precorrin-2/cobalt-factor-2 C20-methyltransferase
VAAAGRTAEAWLVEHAAMPTPARHPLAQAEAVTPYFAILLIHGQGRRP